jgi:hypothetical protein
VAKNNANARIRRRIAEILFEKGEMTRSAVASILLEEGNFRVMPSDASLSAMLAKNIQIIQTGTDKVDVGDGTMTINSVYAIDDSIIRDKEDLVFTRPYSSMTVAEKKNAVMCLGCKQMRLIEEGWSECLICQRKPSD